MSDWLDWFFGSSIYFVIVIVGVGILTLIGLSAMDCHSMKFAAIAGFTTGTVIVLWTFLRQHSTAER